jgi:DNA-binding NtrC family response regulator
MAPARHAAPPLASPYALHAVDAGGHMRKLDDVESEMIRLAISRYDGHMSEVARRLGIGRSTLYRKLKELGLEPGESEQGFADETPHRAAG